MSKTTTPKQDKSTKTAKAVKITTDGTPNRTEAEASGDGRYVQVPAEEAVTICHTACLLEMSDNEVMELVAEGKLKKTGKGGKMVTRESLDAYRQEEALRAMMDSGEPVIMPVYRAEDVAVMVQSIAARLWDVKSALDIITVETQKRLGKLVKGFEGRTAYKRMKDPDYAAALEELRGTMDMEIHKLMGLASAVTDKGELRSLARKTGLDRFIPVTLGRSFRVVATVKQAEYCGKYLVGRVV